jgi:hypothetical protein
MTSLPPSVLPSRLLRQINGVFSVFDPRADQVREFDIISYTWGDPVEPYNCGIPSVTWDLKINNKKLKDIQRFMVAAGVQDLWVDCVCINQFDEREKAVEISNMFIYYKNARRCHILLDMPQVWNPQEIVDDLKFVDHILAHMGGAALASEAMLTEKLINRLSHWATKRDWTFPVDEMTVRSAAIDMGVLNCYSTCIHHVRSLFENPYFTRVWTFQEMILGKNITMWAINPNTISEIGALHIWMDLATDATDKAFKLQRWIESSRVMNTGSVLAILGKIEEDNIVLNSLQMQVMGINSARADIINGGSLWWRENYKGISNIFSAISITPRQCGNKQDIFRGLLGIFSGLFTPEEIERDMSGSDLESISFHFFKQLSVKTGFAWTKLAISSRERGRFDWIPVVENYSGLITTDCFAGVVNLGRLNKKFQAKPQAMTGIRGVPRKYMRIKLSKQPNSGFDFIFRGCNCGRAVKTGLFSTEPIPLHDQPRDVIRDETGRILVQCATLLGAVMDPAADMVEYRRRLLRKLQPSWDYSDPNAKPIRWIDRCVSGTFWENPHPAYLRTHNMSMNYRMVNVTGCESRLQNESTKDISCEVRVNCGCLIIAPFSLVFEAITAVQGSFLGDQWAFRDADNRIVLKDGLGLVQVGDVGRSFNLVAFGGDVDAHRSFAAVCRSTKLDKAVIPKVPWPHGRALVREEFTHGLTDTMRDYGYVETGGSGNLLICRRHVMDEYKIVGVCIDEHLETQQGAQGRKGVTVR